MQEESLMRLLEEAANMIEKIACRHMYRADEQITRKQREALMARIYAAIRSS
jgi:hypothetical protein